MFLNHYVRNLQTVQRWNIFPTIRTQHVAEHSYYVSLYCAEMLERYCAYLSAEDKYTIVLAALKHDAAEARMGDINGPTKRMIRDETRYKELEEQVDKQLGFGEWQTSYFGLKLIKAADCLDEFFFLTTETYLGNRMAEGTLAQVRSRLSDALYNAFQDWVTVNEVIAEADKQMDQMLNFETLQNDTDVRPVAPVYKIDLDEEIPF